MPAFFTIPKPFEGHIGVIQRNALRSWRAVDPAGEILVMGDEPGAREAATEVGGRFLPDLARNEYGTPLLDGAFAAAARLARSEVLCYLNADIVLLPDLPEALARIPWRPFLMVSRRWNLDVTEPLDVGAPDWVGRLRDRVAREGQLFRLDAIDCFAFPRESPLVELPPFAVGRPGWDNYFIYRTRRLGIPVIDATAAVTLVHQNHGYGHVKAGTGDRWEGPEAERNRRLMGGSECIFDIGDATFVLEKDALRPARGLRRALRSLETAHLAWPWLAPVGKLGYALRGIPPFSRRLLSRLLPGEKRAGV